MSLCVVFVVLQCTHFIRAKEQADTDISRNIEKRAYQFAVPDRPFKDDFTTKQPPFVYGPPGLDLPGSKNSNHKSLSIPHSYFNTPKPNRPTNSNDSPTGLYGVPPFSDDDTVVITPTPSNSYIPPVSSHVPPQSDFHPTNTYIPPVFGAKIPNREVNIPSRGLKPPKNGYTDGDGGSFINGFQYTDNDEGFADHKSINGNIHNVDGKVGNNGISFDDTKLSNGIINTTYGAPDPNNRSPKTGYYLYSPEHYLGGFKPLQPPRHGFVVNSFGIPVSRSPSTKYLPPSDEFDTNTIKPPNNDYLPPNQSEDEIPDEPPPKNNYLPPGKPESGYIPPGSNEDEGYDIHKPDQAFGPDEDVPPLEEGYLPPEDDITNHQPPHGYSYPVPNKPFHSSALSRSNGLRVLNMSCLDSPDQKYFRAVLRSHLVPVPDEGVGNCIRGSGGNFRLDLEGTSLKECGIRLCPVGNEARMCLTLRMPIVQGLRIKDDEVVTLQCRPLQGVATRTRQLRINTVNSEARSAAQVTTGGHQRHLGTHVSLVQRSGAALPPGAAVSLGERLILRAQVAAGDGWKHCRLGEVRVRQASSSRSRSVQLVDTRGCRVPRMAAVCPEAARRSGPLLTTLEMRAFMFEGASSGDEMLMSVRIVACMREEDCHQDQECDDTSSRKRHRRNTNVSNVTDLNSYLAFRVVVPETVSEAKKATIFIPVAVVLGISTVLLILFLIACTVCRLKRK